MAKLATGEKPALPFAYVQDPAQTMEEQDTGELIAALCLDKACQSSKFLLHRKASQICWAWQLNTDPALDLCPHGSHHEPSGVTVGVMGKSVILIDT